MVFGTPPTSHQPLQPKMHTSSPQTTSLKSKVSVIAKLHPVEMAGAGLLCGGVPRLTGWGARVGFGDAD